MLTRYIVLHICLVYVHVQINRNDIINTITITIYYRTQSIWAYKSHKYYRKCMLSETAQK